MLLYVWVCLWYLKNVHYFALQELAGKLFSLSLFLRSQFTQLTENCVDVAYKIRVCYCKF